MTTQQKVALKAFGAFVAVVLATSCVRTSAQTVKVPVDPGVRGGAAGAGNPLPGLTADETAFFRDGLARFAEIEVVTGGNNNGLGPRFNSNQCLSCHSQPAAGGSSPARNPSIGIATLNGAKNVVPWFIAPNGPIREARFQRNPNGTNDGGVHDLFVITGRSDAAGLQHRPTRLPACRKPALRPGRESEHHFPHPDASLWRRAHRSNPRLGDPREHEGRRVPEGGVWASPVTPTRT